MRYIHKFKTDSDFQEEYNGEKYKEPWASWTVENDEVNYNKREDGGVITVKTVKWDIEGHLEENATIEYSGTDVSFEELMLPTFAAHGSSGQLSVGFYYENDPDPFANGHTCGNFDKSVMGYVDPSEVLTASKPGEVILGVGDAGDSGPSSPSTSEYPYDLQNERFADWMVGKTMIIQWGEMYC